jgi:hypothetical protein
MSFTEKQLTSIHAAAENLHNERVDLLMHASNRPGCGEYDYLAEEPTPCQQQERLIQTQNDASFIAAALGRALVAHKYEQVTREYVRLGKALLCAQTVGIDYVMQQQAAKGKGEYDAD